MIKRKLLIFMFFAIGLNSFSGGRDILNFYEDTKYENSFGSHIEVKKDPTSDDVNYVFGEGLLSYGDNWYSEYDVRKKYENNVKSEGEPDRDIDGWETTLSLYKKLKPLRYNNKEFYNDAGFVYHYDQLNDTGTQTTKSERSEFSGRYRLRFDSAVGKGGSYSGFDFLLGVVHSVNEDGYHHELNFVNTTNLGYGFQNITTQYNEFLDYDQYNSTYNPSLENIFKWTYDFDENWAFSTELYSNFEKYCNGTTDDYEVEISLLPYLLYNKFIKDNLNIYGKVAPFGYGFEEYRTDSRTTNESGYCMTVVLGFNYYW